MDMKLELVPIPVTDVDRAKAFYTEQLGFVGRRRRAARARRPGGAADAAGVGLLHRDGHRASAAYDGRDPGSVRALHLVVDDIEKARAELVGRGVEVGPVEDVGGGVQVRRVQRPGRQLLTLQEMPWRTGRRVLGRSF